MHNDLIIVIVVATALAFDYTNGFHDTANAIAALVSTRAMAPRVAVIYSVGLHDMGISCQQFTTHYPQAKIRLAYLHPHEVVEAVISKLG